MILPKAQAKVAPPVQPRAGSSAPLHQQLQRHDLTEARTFFMSRCFWLRLQRPIFYMRCKASLTMVSMSARQVNLQSEDSDMMKTDSSYQCIL